MSDPLWKKGDGPVDTDPEIMAFLAGRDVILDRELLPFDIQATGAHAAGLARIGLLTQEELEATRTSLRELQEAFEDGGFVLDHRFEDGHSAIEAWLVDELGETGRKIHTGRSRNDQVAVAMRLYLRDRLDRLEAVCARIAERCLERARKEAQVPMPGHTHLQRAMPSSLGLWWAGHAEAFLDDMELASLVRDWLNASPLGTASGFGVNLPLDRDEVAQELGFPRLVVNPQYAQNSRGKVELRALDALAAATGDLRRVAWDLSLYASDEFGYLSLPDRYCTGSSIMPNKRNPDTVELLRALHAEVVGARGELDTLLGLPSGYHRDLQGAKGPVLRAFASGLEALGLLPGLLDGVEWNTDRLRNSISAELYATDRANELVAQGRAFRDAYRQAAAEAGGLEGRSPEESLEARSSPGGSGNLLLDRLEARLHRDR